LSIIKYLVSKKYLERVREQSKKAGLKDPSELELRWVREYLAGVPGRSSGLIDMFETWEDFGEVNDLQTGRPMNLKFDAEKGALLLQKGRGKGEVLHATTLNEPIVRWLGKTVAFMAAVIRETNRRHPEFPKLTYIEARSDSVSEFLSLFFQTNARAESNRQIIESLTA